MIAASAAVAQEISDSSQRREERARPRAPHLVETLHLDSIDGAPLTRFSDLLTGRIPGFLVQRASGSATGQANFRLRGARSVLMPDEPLVIVDGVRLGGEVAFPQFSNAAPVLPPLSRLDMLDPEQVERIEVLKGPATAALLGTGAANGALLITTREGTPGGARWNVRSTFGPVHEVTDYPANYARVSVAPDGSPVDSLTWFSPLMQESPFNTGWRSELGLGLSTGGKRSTVYAGASYARESGVLGMDRLRQLNLHANGRVALRADLDLAINGAYVDGALREPSSLYLNVIRNGLHGDDSGGTGYLIAPELIRRQRAEGAFGRMIVGATIDWRALGWLGMTTTLGIDRPRLTRADSSKERDDSFDGMYLRLRSDSSRQTTTTLRSVANTKFDLSPSVRTSAVMGVEYLNERATTSDYIASGYLPEIGEPSIWSSNTVTTRLRRSTTALIAQAQLGWRDRLHLNGGVRQERISGEGGHSDSELYPSAGISWNVSEEPWFPSRSPVGTLRLRGAYGEAGQADYARLERTNEREVGLDATALGGRISLELTSYRQVAKHVLLQPLTPPIGSGTPLIFAGRVRNTGVEAVIRASIISGRSLSSDVSVAGATQHNRAERGDSREIFPPWTSVGGRLLIREGYPLAGYWERPILGYGDPDTDGITGCSSGPWCTVTLGDSMVYMGSPLPTRRLSITPRVTYRSWLTLSALFDHHGGVARYNYPHYYRCLRGVCREARDFSAPPADRAAIMASTGPRQSHAGYIEDASFWKLRELSVYVRAPARWASAMGASHLSITLAGRNLATWTPYSGFDPEVSSYVHSYSPLARMDDFVQPPLRHFLARLDLGW